MAAIASDKFCRWLSADHAYLGHKAKIRAVSCRAGDSNLTCTLSIRYRLITVCAGLIGGPYLTMMLSHSHRFPRMPLVLKGVAILLSIAGYSALLTAAVPPKVRFNFETGEVCFSLRVLGFYTRRCVIDLSDVTAVRTGSLTRPATSRSSNMIECYYLQLVLNDGREVRVIETTDRSQVSNAAQLVASRLGSRIQLNDPLLA